MQRSRNQNFSNLPINSKYRDSNSGVRLCNRPVKGFKLIEVWQKSGINFLDHVVLPWGKRPKYKSHMAKKILKLFAFFSDLEERKATHFLQNETGY